MHRWFSQQTLRVWGKNEVVQASCLQIKFTWSCSFWKKLISCFQSTICENGGLDFLFFVTGVDWIATKAASSRNQKSLCDVWKIFASQKSLWLRARCFSNKRCAFGEANNESENKEHAEAWTTNGCCVRFVVQPLGCLLLRKVCCPSFRLLAAE